MIKKLLILLLISSCFAVNNQNIKQLNSLPEFYISPKQNNTSIIYGVGQGYNLHSATRSALAQASSRLMVNISADKKLLLKSNNDNISEQYREQINEKLEKISFNNYKISNSAVFKDQFYVEIAIDRNNFIKQNVIKLNNLNQRFAKLYKNLNQKNIIDQYRNLNNIQSKLYEAKIINIILDSIKYKNIGYKKNYQNYNLYENSFDDIIDKMIFKINPKSDPKISRIIKQILSDQKIKITNRNIKSKNLILINIDQEEISDKIYDSYIVKLRINIELINRGKILDSNLFEASGSSIISKNEAKNSAIIEIYKKIKEKFTL
jgi:hypothetical protein